MQIMFHLGAHCTDDGLLIRSILRNRAQLAEEGIGVPGPGRYRELIGDISTRLRGEKANEVTEAMVLEAICDDDTATRICLSSENFLCRPDVAMGGHGLYPKAEKSAWLRKCVPSCEVEFALCIRNPATFVPELVKANPETAAALEMTPLSDLVWSEVVADIAACNPNARITVWCHEDTPFIWSEVMHEVTGHDPYTELDGEFDMLETIMAPEGMTKMVEFLDTQNVTSQIKRRRTISAFLEVHALEDKLETEVDLPGWTDATVDMLTEAYEDDISKIAAMSEVTFIAP